MNYMFSRATAFNADLSDWDVSSVKNMDMMFFGAKSFERVLCSRAWLDSQAEKFRMFAASPGSISTECASTTQSTITTTTEPGATATCPVCASNKAGKRSCCVRGGAWFDQCGSPGDPNYEHTWADGIKSCQSKLWWMTCGTCVYVLRCGVIDGFVAFFPRSNEYG